MRAVSGKRCAQPHRRDERQHARVIRRRSGSPAPPARSPARARRRASACRSARAPARARSTKLGVATASGPTSDACSGTPGRVNMSGVAAAGAVSRASSATARPSAVRISTNAPPPSPAEKGWVDRQREGRRDRRVDRVAALLEHARARRASRRACEVTTMPRRPSAGSGAAARAAGASRARSSEPQRERACEPRADPRRPRSWGPDPITRRRRSARAATPIRRRELPPDRRHAIATRLPRSRLRPAESRREPEHAARRPQRRRRWRASQRAPHDVAVLDLGELGSAAHRAAARARAAHRRALRRARRAGLLRRHHLPPRDPGLHDPGRRSAHEEHGPARRRQRRLRRSASPDEFSDYPHLRGTVSLANTGRPNSGDSQFFIVQQDTRAPRRRLHGLRSRVATAWRRWTPSRSCRSTSTAATDRATGRIRRTP